MLKIEILKNVYNKKVYLELDKKIYWYIFYYCLFEYYSIKKFCLERIISLGVDF